MIGPAGVVTFDPPTRITIAGTHVISPTDGPVQWLTASADTVVSLADPGLAWCWRLTVVVDPNGHTVTLPTSASSVPCRWPNSGLAAQPYGVCSYIYDWTPGLGWEATLSGGDIR